MNRPERVAPENERIAEDLWRGARQAAAAAGNLREIGACFAAAGRELEARLGLRLPSEPPEVPR